MTSSFHKDAEKRARVGFKSSHAFVILCNKSAVTPTRRRKTHYIIHKIKCLYPWMWESKWAWAGMGMGRHGHGHGHGQGHGHSPRARALAASPRARARARESARPEGGAHGQSGPGAHIFKENRLLGAPTLKISPAALVTCGAHCCTRPGPRPPTRHSHACMVRRARRRPGGASRLCRRCAIAAKACFSPPELILDCT